MKPLSEHCKMMIDEAGRQGKSLRKKCFIERRVLIKLYQT